MRTLSRKEGSTFRRLVLLDESVFQQLKRGALTTSASAARAYIKDRMTGQLQSATLSDRDKLNIHREMRAALEQLDKPIAATARAAEHITVDSANSEPGVATSAPRDTLRELDADDDGDGGDSEYEDAPAGEKTFGNVSSASTVLAPPLAPPAAKKLPTVQVPPQYRRKYEAIDKLLEQSGAVSVDHAGQMTLDGQLIAGSDYAKIIKSLFVKSNEGDNYTRGRTRLLCWMAAAGVPTNAVSVDTAQDAMQRWYNSNAERLTSQPPKQAGDGLPPGKRPKLLCMYKL